MLNTVSIIIPTYNGENFIKETIDSCLNQSYGNIEIIVVDDCSADSTIKILKNFGDKINLHLNKENCGISKNVNKGLGFANGKYFILLGHDDVLPVKHVEVMLSEFDDNIIAVHCNSIVIDENGSHHGNARDDSKQIIKTANCMFELSLDNFVSSCGMMHKTSVFKDLNGWNENYKNYGEWLFYVNELQHGNLKYTIRTNAYYRKHKSNITNSFKDRAVAKQLTLYKNICRDLAYSYSMPTLPEKIKFIYYRNQQLKSFLKRLIRHR